VSGERSAELEAYWIVEKNIGVAVAVASVLKLLSPTDIDADVDMSCESSTIVERVDK
jgi:hypothetical protein